MFYVTKINKNINKKEGARNYRDDSTILMDGVWLMVGYPKPNGPLQRTLDTMKDLESVKGAIQKTLDRDFIRELEYTPITYRGARALYNRTAKQYHFVNDSYLEMIDLDKCNILSTDNIYEPIIFKDTTDKDKWLMIMPIRVEDEGKWLKTNIEEE